MTPPLTLGRETNAFSKTFRLRETICLVLVTRELTNGGQMSPAASYRLAFSTTKTPRKLDNVVSVMIFLNGLHDIQIYTHPPKRHARDQHATQYEMH